MANVFDQFDSASSQASPSGGNVFDQFDAPTPRKVRSYDNTGDGLVPSEQMVYGPEGSDRTIQAVKNVGEGAAQLGTGMFATAAGDVAGLGALGYDIVANGVVHPFSGATPGGFADPAAIRERVANYLTYRPSDPNSLTSKALSFPGKVIGGAGEELAQMSDNAYVQDVLRAVPQAAASYLGVRAASPLKSKEGVPIPSKSMAPPPEATPEQVAIKNATDVGYKLTPTQVGNKVGGAAEGISGQAALERSLSKQNVTITDSLAKNALGIKDKPLNSATIGMEKAKANKAYEQIAGTGVRKTSDEYRQEIAGIDDRTGAGSFAEDVPPAVTNLKKYYASREAFNAKDAVAKVRQLRADGRANIKTRDPEKAALGNAQLKVAEALDNELARHVDDLGMKDLAANYKAARVQLAKLNTVEQALSGTNVSAKKIWQQWKRGAPLEGELLAIARTYDSFSHVLQEASKIRQKHPFSVVDAFVAAGGAAINPALLGAVAARPLTRAALASDTYQRNFVQPRGRAATPPQTTRGPTKVVVPAPSDTNARKRRAG